jgi:hypothetical protein
MKLLQRTAAMLMLAAGYAAMSGCTTTTLVVMHVIDKVTEGMPVPCHKLNSVERALQTRCGAFVEGSLREADIVASGPPVCPLTVATADPRLWPVLPELIAKGAMPERCAEAPLVVLARTQGSCPDFASASRGQIAALRWLAEADARAVHHDVMRMFSCPGARQAGLDTVLEGWAAQGVLARGSLPFAPLGALHPSHLRSTLAARLEAQGHRARDALGGRVGALPSGFDEALRAGEPSAIDWWLDRVPELARGVPSVEQGQMSWLPLARVITPAYQSDATRREQTAVQLLARGADPSQRLPHDRQHTVLDFAREIRSPLVPMLEAHAVRTAGGRATALPMAAAAAARSLD